MRSATIAVWRRGAATLQSTSAQHPWAVAVASSHLIRSLSSSAALASQSTAPVTSSSTTSRPSSRTSPTRPAPSNRSLTISDLLRILSTIHSNPSRTCDQRRYLDLLQTLYHTDPTSHSHLGRGHIRLLMSAAKTCHHPSIAFWLLHTLYPPPPIPPPTPPGPWPRDMETAFHIITAVDVPHAAKSPQILTDLLLLLSQHGYPVLPSQLTPALLF